MFRLNRPIWSMLQLIIQCKKLSHAKEIMLTLVLLIQHFKLLKANVPMAMFIHKFEYPLHLIETQLDSEVFNTLSEFI